MRLFDSHAHYDDRKFDEDRFDILADLPKAGICGVMSAASDLESAELGIGLAEKYDFVWASAGIHPHEAKDAPQDYIERLAALLSRPRVQALGEIGLDYHYD
jgi:TatD DNase family protein